MTRGQRATSLDPLLTSTKERHTLQILDWDGEVRETVTLRMLVPKGPLRYGRFDRSTDEVEQVFKAVRSDDYWVKVAGWERLRPLGWFDISTCGGCGTAVIWDLKRSRWSYEPHPPCSEKCRSRMRRGPRQDLTRACEHCGEMFTPTRSDARFCSTRCRVAAHRAA